MGQYYITVSIDKGEYIYPHSFGDGLKLLEFGASGNGTMLGLALLLASGNGRGGGDIYRSGKVSKVKTRKFERLEEEFDTPDGMHRIVVPKISGRWAGDRIVIAGDYADPDLFGIQTSRNNHPDDFADNGTDYGPKRNLYKLAQEQYNNISGQVIAAMCVNPMIRDDYANMYVGRRSDSEHPFVVAMKEAMYINRDLRKKVNDFRAIEKLETPNDFRNKIIEELGDVYEGPESNSADIKSPADLTSVYVWLARYGFARGLSDRNMFVNEFANIRAVVDDRNGGIYFDYLEAKTNA